MRKGSLFESLAGQASGGSEQDEHDDDSASVVSRRTNKTMMSNSPGAKSRGRASEGPNSASKFANGSAVDDMSRARDFEARLSIADLLDGKPMGDHLYAARRFSPTLPGAQLKMTKLLKRAAIAEQLSAPKLKDLTEERRTALVTALGQTTECSLEYSRRLLMNLIDGDFDHEVIGAALAPWASVMDGSAQPVNMLSPKVSAMSCSPSAKVEVFETILLESVLAGLVLKGEEGLPHVYSFIASLKDIIADGESLVPLPASFATCLGNLKVLAAVLAVLIDPSPTAVSECGVDLKLVQDMAMGQGTMEPWSLVSDCLDANDYWADLKMDFRRGATSDMVIGRDMLDSLKAVPGADIEELKNITEKVPSWAAQCRKGGTVEIETAILRRADALLEDIGKEADMAKRAERIGVLDKLLTTASLLAFKQTGELKKHMSDLKKSARTVCEDASRIAMVSGLIKALQSFATATNQETMEAVRTNAKACEGMRFVLQDHVASLRAGVRAALDALVDPTSQRGWGKAMVEDKASCWAEAFEDVKMFGRILGMVAEHTKEDEVAKATLKYLEYSYTVMASVADLQAFDKARAGLDAINSMAYFGPDAERIAGDAAFAKGLQTCKVNFMRPLKDAQDVMTEWAGECFSEAKAQWTAALAKLTPITGGEDHANSKLWKSDCIGADYDTVMKTAMGSLFKQRGIARKCIVAREALVESLEKVKSVAGAYGMEASANECEEQSAEVLKKVSITIIEAKLLQVIKDKAPAAVKRTNLESTMDSMVGYNLVSTDIEACIYDKVQGILKS